MLKTFKWFHYMKYDKSKRRNHYYQIICAYSRDGPALSENNCYVLSCIHCLLSTHQDLYNCVCMKFIGTFLVFDYLLVCSQYIAIYILYENILSFCGPGGARLSRQYARIASESLYWVQTTVMSSSLSEQFLR